MIAGVSWEWWLGFHAAVAALLVIDSLLPGHRRETRHSQLFAWIWTAVLVLVCGQLRGMDRNRQGRHIPRSNS